MNYVSRHMAAGVAMGFKYQQWFGVVGSLLSRISVIGELAQTF